MNAVQPIRDRKTIEQIKAYLLERNVRDYLLFVLGINTALRVGDILAIRKADAVKNGKIRDFLKLRIGKTNKTQRVGLNSNAKKALKLYLNVNPNLVDYSPLFPGRQSLVPMSRVGAWKRLQIIAREFDLEDFGFHSLRKSWGYHSRKMGVDISIISHKLGHSSISVTKRYLGITDDEVNEIELAVCL